MKTAGWAGCFAFTIVVLVSASPVPAQTGAAATAEADVRRVIADYNAAYEKNDLETYFKAFAPDLTQWFPSGRVDLPSYRASWTKSVEAGNTNEKVEVRDLRVQVSPSADAAVATYILRVTFRTAKGVATTDDNQETDVLFKRNGAWTIVHVNYAAAQPSAPR
ncbi:MAG: nuclear transport factor 2 family protein [Acidobacteria bacterium]|nr:nuclear transport factor 2 family protein [Acidobacteriota bacterium]